MVGFFIRLVGGEIKLFGSFWIFWIVPIAICIVFTLSLYLFKWSQYRNIVSFKGRLLSQVNLARNKKHIRPLGRVIFLDKVAVGHSKSMARQKHCDHSGFLKRASLIQNKTGLNHVGENCYMFPAKRYNAHVAKKLVQGWLKSSGHRANLLSPTFKRTGIGIVVKKGYVYATQLFTD